MEIRNALDSIRKYKGESLKNQLDDLKSSTLNKRKNEILQNNEMLYAAIIVKKASAQINEIVHAYGIINSLPKIMTEDEIVEDLSLASGADGEGFDLVTNKRIAEFKFARWQKNKANGMRKRQVAADLVNLMMKQTQKKKELYVVDAEMVIRFFNGKSKWENVLSKSGVLKEIFEEYLNKNRGINCNTMKDVYQISNVSIIDIEQILEISF